VPERLLFKELAPQQVSRDAQANLIAARDALAGTLRPRRPVLVADSGQVTFQNLVGSALLADGSVVEVEPKVDGLDDWTTAVVHLLEADTRIAVTGSQRSHPSTRRSDLSSALAMEFARRLEKALRAEGPLTVYERRNHVSRRLNGHLDVTQWVRTAVLDPAAFPISRDELTAANDFTRGLSLVSGWLSRVAVGGELASRMRRLQTAVIPGHPVPTFVNPSASRRQVPSQWGKYKPAWDIAAPLLRHLSVVGDPGRATGLEVAIEPWPLLETATERALAELARRENGWEFVPKGSWRLLSRRGRTSLHVVPDGMLRRNGEVAATFECKYTVPGETPKESHVHQALTTAAAVGSPLSVLVYPGSQPPRWFDVCGFNGTPQQLVTIGMDLFSYRRGIGDVARADKIAAVLAGLSR
jgi:hypothetical protein